MVDELLDPLRAVRRMVRRSLHPFRRRVARQAVRSHAAARSILVVCHGNICRSPFAAARLRAWHAAADVRSAGFLAPGRPVPPTALTASLRFGTDLSTHRSAILTPSLVLWADLILVMDPPQARHVYERFGRAARDLVVLGDLDPETADARAILDPIDQRAEVFVKCYARIERCVREVVKALQAARSERAA